MTALHRWMWHWSDLDVTLYVHTSVASFFENHRQEPVSYTHLRAHET